MSFEEITADDVDQRLGALGVHTTMQLAYDKRADRKLKNKVIFGALGPVFREIVLQYVSPNKPEKNATGLLAIEKDFAHLFEQRIAPSKGRPSHFKQCCAAWDLDASDSSWILHVVIVSLLQGVIKHYAQHLSQGVTDDQQTSRDGASNDGSLSDFGQKLQNLLAGIDTESLGVPLPSSNVDTSELRVQKTMGRTKWQGRLQAAEHIWENFSLALLLQRGDETTSNWIEASLKQTTGPKKVNRKTSQMLVKDGQEELLSRVTPDSASGMEANQVKFSVVLMDLVLAVLEQANPSEPAIKLDTNDGHDVRRLRPSKSVLIRLMQYQDKVRLTDSSGPLRNPPRPWEMEGKRAGGIKRGGLHHRRLNFYKFRSKNNPIRDFLEEMDKDSPAFEQVFRAVNALQNTRWQINEKIWNVLSHLIAASKDPEVIATGLTASLDLSGEMIPGDKWNDWLEGHFFARLHFKDEDGLVEAGDQDLSSPGWRLISPVGAPEIMRLAKWRGFYFAYNVDSRGRIYPTGSYIQPQGEDVFRALLEFGEAKAITEEGVKHLKLHGSQCASRDRILADLNIKDKTSLTTDERLMWIDRNSAQICACANNPFVEIWWRDVGGKSAFQFLAFCFAWDEYVTGGGAAAHIRLPVHVDGTCNGLQHIAALTRSTELAKAVNLLEGDPRDIYLEVAEKVQKNASNLDRKVFDPGNANSPFMRVLAKREDVLRQIIKNHPKLIDRSAAKEVVMVIPYGASVRAYVDNLARHIADYQDFDALKDALSEIGKEAMEALAEDQAKKLRDKERKDAPGKTIAAARKKPITSLNHDRNTFTVVLSKAARTPIEVTLEFFGELAKNSDGNQSGQQSEEGTDRHSVKVVKSVRAGRTSFKVHLDSSELTLIGTGGYTVNAKVSPENEDMPAVERVIAEQNALTDKSWMPLSYGRLMLATLLANEFDMALSEQYPVIKEFKEWLLGLVRAVTDRKLPMCWVSPTGFAVLQNAFEEEIRQIDLKGITKIRMSQYALTDNINAKDQLLGILPNFIHSLDGAHLVSTVLKTMERLRRRTEGQSIAFSMIHDSFGTHACFMPDLEHSLREAFKETYTPDRLEEFRTFAERYINRSIPEHEVLDSRTATENRLISLYQSADALPVALMPFATADSKDSFDISSVMASKYFFY